MEYPIFLNKDQCMALIELISKEEQHNLESLMPERIAYNVYIKSIKEDAKKNLSLHLFADSIYKSEKLQAASNEH